MWSNIRQRRKIYGGSKIPVVGQVQIHVCRGDYQGLLDCKLVDSTEIRPLLGRKACIEMKIIKYMDNDELRKPNTGSFPVYTLDSTKGVVTNQSPLQGRPPPKVSQSLQSKCWPDGRWISYQNWQGSRFSAECTLPSARGIERQGQGDIRWPSEARHHHSRDNPYSLD